MAQFCRSCSIDSERYPIRYEWTLIAFAINVIVLFVSGLVLRLYLIPRAEDKRRKDFFSSACNVALTYERTEGYYNNDFTQPIKRIAAQVLENSHFSKSITGHMARRERIKIVVYASLWVMCVVNRQTDLNVIVAASQAVFSEEILAKWVRLEWLRTRFEQTYEDVYRLLQTQPAMTKYNAIALDAMAMYETSKANAAITLSNKVFQKLNPRLSEEWNTIKSALGI